MQRRTLIHIALASTAFAFSGLGQAQDFPPKKAVTMVVGFAAGGAADAVARLVAKKVGGNIGQTVGVDHKGGAGGHIA
ncbi:MAG: tripartite tricarboxylate transporter substrate binding protein, partial [Comamonas sp.]